jgi:hypothetical protein
MNSKQGARYIKGRMGNDLKQKILEHNGIISGKELKTSPTILNCGRCGSTNSYPINPLANGALAVQIFLYRIRN